MQREIVDWHQDDEGDWVAELACGHRQHVRHNPPLWPRPWVLTHDGRTARLGTTLPCPPCGRSRQ